MAGVTLIRLLKESGLRLFTTQDAARLLKTRGANAAQLLRRMAQQKLVLRLKRGVWVNLLTPAFRLEEALPYWTHPWPSYVSLYSALAEQGLIAEIPQVIYGVSAGRGFHAKTPLGTLVVHHLPEEAVWGFELSPSGEGSFPLAEPEKALLDLVYLAGIPRSGIAFPRFRKKPSLDVKKLKAFASRWGHRRLKSFAREWK